MAETFGPASEMLYVATDCMGDTYRAALVLSAAITAKKSPRNRDVRIALLGDAVFLMKDQITQCCLPSGRPCLKDLVAEAVGLGIPFHV